LILVAFFISVFILLGFLRFEGRYVLGYALVGAIWSLNFAANVLAGKIAMSDELFFLEADWLYRFPARFIWLVLNNIASLDIGEPIIIMKSLNLIFAFGFFTWWVNNFRHVSPVIWCLIFPYLGVLASYNFRDILIVWFTMLAFQPLWSGGAIRFSFSATKVDWRAMLGVTLLIFLRPIQAVTIIGAYVRLRYLVAGGVGFFIL